MHRWEELVRDARACVCVCVCVCVWSRSKQTETAIIHISSGKHLNLFLRFFLLCVC